MPTMKLQNQLTRTAMLIAAGRGPGETSQTCHQHDTKTLRV